MNTALNDKVLFLCDLDCHVPNQIEYMVVWFDDAERNAKLSLRQTEILQELKKVEDELRAKLDDGETCVSI